MSTSSCKTLLIAFCAAIASTAAFAQGSGNLHRKAIETFSASGSCDDISAGTQIGSVYRFTEDEHVTSLTFTSGNVNWNGYQIDFHGHENDFASGEYLVTFDIPTAGASLVDAVGTASVTGPITAVASGSGQIQKGPNFSIDFPDLAVGSTTPAKGSTPNWQSNVMPQLNGVEVSVEGSHYVANSDIVNRVITGTYVGTIYVPTGSLNP